MAKGVGGGGKQRCAQNEYLLWRELTFAGTYLGLPGL